MRSDLADEFRRLLENEVESRPSSMCFELAYQARIAIDRIRFAITQIEKIGSRLDVSGEACIQLLDALDRLKGADLNFQRHFRRSMAPKMIPERVSENRNGSAAKSNTEAT
jgi:hypothetical protein